MADLSLNYILFSGLQTLALFKAIANPCFLTLLVRESENLVPATVVLTGYSPETSSVLIGSASLESAPDGRPSHNLCSCISHNLDRWLPIPRQPIPRTLAKIEAAPMEADRASPLIIDLSAIPVLLQSPSISKKSGSFFRPVIALCTVL